MLLKQAAKKIGITTSQLSKHIRNGRLKAKKTPNPFVRHGFHYEITDEALAEFMKLDKPSGFPRGEKRDGLRGMKLEHEENGDAETSQTEKTKTAKKVPAGNKARKGGKTKPKKK